MIERTQISLTIHKGVKDERNIKLIKSIILFYYLELFKII